MHHRQNGAGWCLRSKSVISNHMCMNTASKHSFTSRFLPRPKITIRDALWPELPYWKAAERPLWFPPPLAQIFISWLSWWDSILVIYLEAEYWLLESNWMGGGGGGGFQSFLSSSPHGSHACWIRSEGRNGTWRGSTGSANFEIKNVGIKVELCNLSCGFHPEGDI